LDLLARPGRFTLTPASGVVAQGLTADNTVVALDDANAVALRLSGTAAALTTLLATAGAVKYDPQTDSASSLDVRLWQGGVRGTISLPVLYDSQKALTVYGPQFALQTSFRVPANSVHAQPVTFAAAPITYAGAASDALSLQITAEQGQLSASSSAGVTASGSGSSPVTLTGTAAALNAFLLAGKLGLQANSATTLSFRALGPAVNGASAADESSRPLSIRVAGLTVTGSGTDLITLSGEPSLIRNALTQTGVWVNMPRQNGLAVASASLIARVMDDSGQVNAQTVTGTLNETGPAGQQSAPRLSLPATTTVVSGTATPLKLGTDRIVYTGTRTLELTVDADQGVVAGTAGNGVTLLSQGNDLSLLRVTGSADALDAWITAGRLTLASSAATTLRISVREVDGRVTSEAVTRVEAVGNSANAALAQIGNFSIGFPAKVGSTTLVLPASAAGSVFSGGTATSALAHQLRLQVASGTLTATSTSTVTVVSGNGTGDLVVSGLPQNLLSWLKTVTAASPRFTPANSLTTPIEFRMTLTEPQSGTAASVVSTISFPTPQQPVLVQDAPRVALPATVTVADGGVLSLGSAPVGLALAAVGELTASLEIPSGSAGALKATPPAGVSIIASGNAATDARLLVLKGDAQALARFLGRAGSIRWEAPAGSALPTAIKLSVSTGSSLGETPVLSASTSAQ
ncbi:MAG: hypothetical protein EBT33_21960, partial [Betaproteobacteria bacterium]|nr:hypothetical protein [Betaproteobacteria bacterium]